ncbi:TPR-like protein, partial [Metschnikowia bicuspidata var. bicuspidata NRRL YB-4993]
MERKAFLDQQAPPGYVAGVGRGATGFQTSADSGPVRFESQFGREADGNDDLEAGILAQTASRSKEDDEADLIYEEIDRRMQSRRKNAAGDKRQAETSQSVEIPTGNGTIRQEFSLLKSELAQVSMEEWANLPEVGDLTRRNKRQRLLDQQQQRMYAAPDILISSTGSTFRYNSDSKDLSSVQGADESAAKLAEIEEWEQNSAMVGDLEKSRLILTSLRRAEPYKADLWISSARLEEQARQMPRAKSLITKGCDLIPHNDQIWLERIRLHRSEGTKTCKAIMNEALRYNSQSEKLWFAALDLENAGDVLSRKKIIMKALEFLPSNVNLWKALIDMDSTEDDKIRLLNRATELCPDEWDLWLTLVNMSNYSDAKSVLNKARKQLPKEANVWITALKLEERENASAPVDKLVGMISKGKKDLAKTLVFKTASEWLDEAKRAQDEGFCKTSQAIIISALTDLEVGSDSEQLQDLAESHLASGPDVASHIYQFIAERHPKTISNWTRLFGLLRKDLPRLYKMYELAIENNPENEILPLMYAKDKWLLGLDVPAARKILDEAVKSMPKSEMVWYARLKLEVKNGQFIRAKEISEEAVQLLLGSSARVWYKHIHILRYCHLNQVGLVSMEHLLTISKNALDLYPENPKLYLQRSQILIDMGDKSAARECLSVGTKFCPQSVIIWLSLATLDLDISAEARARSVLDTAVSRLPSEPDLWEAKIKLEFKLKDFVTARQLINKALKSFPACGRIWILHLKNIPKMSHRKNAFLDALKQTNNSTDILLAIGVFFWLDGKFSKAKAWFERALISDKANGDAWGWMHCFETRYGKEEDLKKFNNDFLKTFDEIRLGNVWNRVVKVPQNFDRSPLELLKLVGEEITRHEA